MVALAFTDRVLRASTTEPIRGHLPMAAARTAANVSIAAGAGC
jgi:hypothetical protein